MHAYPGRANRASNPFNALLADALERRGWSVIDPRVGERFFGRADIVHIHWPQQAAKPRLPVALRRCAALVAMLAVQRLRGARVVWTVHDVHAYDQTHPRLERALMSVVLRLVDGAVFMTAHSRAVAYQAMPALAILPNVVIPHGLYADCYPQGAAPAEARRGFGLPADAAVIGFIGDVKPYKGLDVLLEAFADGAAADAWLLVAGRLPQGAEGDALRRRIGELRDAGRPIVLADRRLDDQELADAVAASTVVALPYKTGWNSGLAMLAIERGRPLLTSDAPVFQELGDQLGPQWVRRARSLGAQDVADSVLAPPPPPQAAADYLKARDWDTIARQTETFYRRVSSSLDRSMAAASRRR